MMSDMMTQQVTSDTNTTDTIADDEHQEPAQLPVGGEPFQENKLLNKPKDMDLSTSNNEVHHQTESPADEVSSVTISAGEESKDYLTSENVYKNKAGAAISSDTDLKKLDSPTTPDDKDTHGSVVQIGDDVISKVEKAAVVSMSDKVALEPGDGGCYLRYAEVLYKCSLCATLPAILTSRDHFSRHVREVHLASRGHKCPSCHLHFDAQDDIKRHHNHAHLEPDSKMGININNNITDPYHSYKMSNVLNYKSLNSVPRTNTCSLSGKHEDGSNPRNFDDGTDSTPCRSRRKRSFPRHLETGEQSQRSASTDSASSCYSEESHNSEPLDPLHQIDQSLLRSDRKRLLVPWSQWTKAPPCEKSQKHGSDDTSRYSDEELRRKATICYKPGALEYNCLPQPSKSACTETRTGSPMEDSKINPGPLDLVLQDRSRCTDTPKTTHSDSQHCLASESADLFAADTPEHKRRKLQEEGIPSNRESPIPTDNDIMRMAYPSPSQYQAMYAAWSMNFYNLSRQQAATNNLMGRNCPDGSLPNLGFTRVKEEPLETAEKACPSCAQCKLEFVSAEEFCQHYKEVHLALAQPPTGQSTAASSTSTGDQQFKVLWLKQHITKYLLPCEGGVVLRDELLDHMMATGVDTSDTATWGPACNRAVRETYQHSQAHRKGKFKKTYFFGVKFVESLSSSSSTAEETRHSLNQAEEEVTDEEEDEEEDLEYLRGPGRCTKDLEKLTAHLPCVIRWTGHMDACITRDTLLQAMSRLLADSDVTTWGLQCSRAVKQLYPEVSIRRKGKYKTCYYGIEMINRGGRQLATWSRTNTGPPVVNVRDILETPAPSSLSRLPQNQPGARSMTASPHNSTKQSQSPSHNPLQAILDLLPTGCQSNSMTTPMWYQRNSDRGPVVRTMCEGVQGGARSPASRSRGSSPASDRSDITKTSVSSEKDARSSTESPQSLPLALTTKNTEKEDTNSPSHTQNQPASPGRSFTTSGPVDALEKLVLLHPGPFVTARIFSRRFQRLVPGLDKVLYAMNMLQGRGLGQVFTLKQGNSKVFFKALPSKSLEVPLTVLGVRMVDYQVMFYERDQKLEDTLHEKLKAFYPQPDLLPTYYSH